MTSKVLPTLIFWSVVLTLWHVSEFLGGLIKMQTAGPHPELQVPWVWGETCISTESFMKRAVGTGPTL